MRKVKGTKIDKEPVESYVLEMYTKLRNVDDAELKREIVRMKGDLGSRLVLMRKKIAEHGLGDIESIARDISHDALKLGATSLLDAAIRMQGAVRGNNSGMALDLLDQMESEMSRLADFIAKQ